MEGYSFLGAVSRRTFLSICPLPAFNLSAGRSFFRTSQKDLQLSSAAYRHLIKEISCQVEPVETGFKTLIMADFDKLSLTILNQMTCIKKHFRSNYYGVSLSLSKAGL